jgi:hypothetical protein
LVIFLIKLTELFGHHIFIHAKIVGFQGVEYFRQNFMITMGVRCVISMFETGATTLKPASSGIEGARLAK